MVQTKRRTGVHCDGFGAAEQTAGRDAAHADSGYRDIGRQSGAEQVPGQPADAAATAAAGAGFKIRLRLEMAAHDRLRLHLSCTDDDTQMILRIQRAQPGCARMQLPTARAQWQTGTSAGVGMRVETRLSS